MIRGRLASAERRCHLVTTSDWGQYMRAVMRKIGRGCSAGEKRMKCERMSSAIQEVCNLAHDGGGRRASDSRPRVYRIKGGDCAVDDEQLLRQRCEKTQVCMQRDVVERGAVRCAGAVRCNADRESRRDTNKQLRVDCRSQVEDADKGVALALRIDWRE